MADLIGLQAVARALGTSEKSVQRYARFGATDRARAFDPLRLWFLHPDGPVRISEPVARAWWRRTFEQGRAEVRIEGVKAICERVERSRTAAWEATQWAWDPLPMFNSRAPWAWDPLPTFNSRVPWAWESALADWLAAQRVYYACRIGRSIGGRSGTANL